MNMRLSALGVCVFLLSASLGAAQTNWPQFRGEAAGVVADDPALPESWGPDENVVWRVGVPGRGWASPIVWGDHVFVLTSTAVEGDEVPIQPIENYRARSLGGTMTAAFITDMDRPLRWVLLDIDFETGETRWEHTAAHRRARAAGPPEEHLRVGDAGHRRRARLRVSRRHRALRGRLLGRAGVVGAARLAAAPPVGAASSPVLHDGRLYVVNDNEEASWVAAFDAATGDELWRTDRDERSNWSTPFVWENDVRTELVTTGQGGVKSYGLDGELLWQLSGMSSLVIPTPFSENGLLYINSGYVADRNRPVYAIRAGAGGDITLPEGATSNDYIVWSHPQLGSYNPSSLVYGGTHYTLLDRGILMAYDAGSGSEVYRRRRITAGTLFTASPWAYNGKIFALSEDGDTFVMQAGEEFEVLGRNSLGEMTLATPAVARGSLLIRTASGLYRITESGD